MARTTDLVHILLAEPTQFYLRDRGPRPRVAARLLARAEERRTQHQLRAAVRLYFRLIESYGLEPEARAAVQRLRRIAARLLLGGHSAAARAIGARLARAGHP